LKPIEEIDFKIFAHLPPGSLKIPNSGIALLTSFETTPSSRFEVVDRIDSVNFKAMAKSA